MKNLIFLFSVLLFWSCADDSKIADYMTDINKGKWEYDQIPTYPFEVDNANVYFNFYLKLRVSKSYPYENLYLLAHIKGPNGKTLTQRVNFTLTDATGKPLGRSTGSAIDYELPMFKDKKMKGVGQYTISLEQNMRDSVINGIESLGVKIKKGDPIF